MEYVLLSLFILLVIFLLVLFLGSWQITSAESQQRKMTYQRAMFLLRAFSDSPLLNKEGENSMFEDSKLTALKCEDLEYLFGSGWFVEIKSLSITEECNEDNYPVCGYWSYCKKENKNMISYDVPVNIYRKTTREIDTGILTVGVYV